jgi:hypothetical protein
MRPKLLLMTRSENVYEFEEHGRNLAGTRFYFISNGIKPIVKVVEYKYIGIKQNKFTYNLGFGTYNQDNDTIQDDDISANGDTYKVFNTVLSTIPYFMNNYPEVMVVVEGSDSVNYFPEVCRPNCKKKCVPPGCKNAHRRINIYKNYVNKNWELLTQEYNFWGGFKTTDYQSVIEEYRQPNIYDAVYFQKIM